MLALFGPTASGKTAVAAVLTRRIPADVVSADSMQAYRGLPVLTAQPHDPTRLVGIWDLGQTGSLGDYQRRAHAAIDEIVAAGRVALVVGGSGLYLHAALLELGLPPRVPPAERERWQELYDRLGPEDAHALLAERDEHAAAAIHPNDRRRVVRALELSSAGTSLVPNEDRLWSRKTRHPAVIVGLEVPRDRLEVRIRARAEEMFAAGVQEEVRAALRRPVSETARYALGFAEIADLPSEQALERLVRRTRTYAQYQRKWMRRIPGLVSVNADRPPDEVADEILEVARTRQQLSARRTG